jgi:TIR domain
VSVEHNVDRARIFVSFAGEDRARAMELVRWLNDGGWHVVADDRHSFTVPDGAVPAERLDSCDVVVCVVTPGWIASESCRHEFSYCAKRGKFILPVICELADLATLPPAVRALPRVDLRGNRLIDYLALKESLIQAGAKISRLADAAGESGRPRRWAFARMLARRLWGRS